MLRRSVRMLVYGKPNNSHSKRKWHSVRSWEIEKGNWLTATPRDHCLIGPNYPAFPEDVDKIMTIPEGKPCLQCCKTVDTEHENEYVWMPSGDAVVPAKHGYLFHRSCFRCYRCGYRFYLSKFATKDGKAHCISCALGKYDEGFQPMKLWHSPTVEPGLRGSRRVGRFFPRHAHQMQFIHDPDE